MSGNPMGVGNIGKSGVILGEQFQKRRASGGTRSEYSHDSMGNIEVYESQLGEYKSTLELMNEERNMLIDQIEEIKCKLEISNSERGEMEVFVQDKQAEIGCLQTCQEELDRCIQQMKGRLKEKDRLFEAEKLRTLEVDRSLVQANRKIEDMARIMHINKYYIYIYIYIWVERKKSRRYLRTSKNARS